MKERLSFETMALRCVKEFNDGDCVNLGYGIPQLCAALIPTEKQVHMQAEHGVLGYGELIRVDEWEKADPDYLDAGGRFFVLKPGICFFDMGLSFDMIRGKHLDAAVLGGLEVSERGDLANWTLDLTETAANIGGGMDLAVGARRLIIPMTHTTKDGKPKVVKKCKYPLTAKGCVSLIVTDIAVIEVTKKGLLLKEVAPGWTAAEVQALTEPELAVSGDLKEIEL